jgi:hypothetical protein
LSARSDCQTGLCDGDGSGMCTAACVDNRDCGPGLLCSGSPYVGVDGDYCADPCSTDADCPSGRTCQVRRNRDETGFDLVCAAPPGTLDTGATPPSNGLDCRSGIRLTGGPCTKLCTVAPDSCVGSALPLCSPLELTLPSGNGTQRINVCTPR